MKLIIITTISSILLFACQSKLTEEDYIKLADEIHKDIVSIDTHSDTPLRLLDDEFNLAEKHDPYKTGSKVDFPRMKEGGLDAMFFAVFIGQGNRDNKGNEQARNKALKIFNKIHESVTANSNIAEIAKTSEDVYRIKKSDKRAVYIGIENGYPVGKDISLIEKFYQLGARYITLCHTKNNDICDSSTDKKGEEHNGVSEFGEKVITEMNRLGMLIDVSHISDSAFYDVLRLSKSPVIASHSCARALCDNPRNLNDEMLKALAEKDGVIQMCILSDYVKTPEPNPAKDKAMADLREKYNDFKDLSDEESKAARKGWREIQNKFPGKLAKVKDVVDHIDHIVKIAGIDHVGIGTDFDGGGGIEDCYDVSQMKNITIELLKRGYNKNQIRKIWSENFLKVFKQNEKLADINEAS
ncbi:MAG: dipeptidase [Melioribacteraceae bacterium]|nr:dipeptidase [Melioribacteraceae bacterium]